MATSLSTAGATGAGVAALFWRERSKRSRQLKRMEKELNAESLEVRLPVRKGISSVRPNSTLKQLKGKRRIVAVRGTKEQFIASGITDTLCVLRRRLVQSQTLVVLVPTDGRETPTKEAMNWHGLHSTLKVDPLHREWLNHQSCWSY